MSPKRRNNTKAGDAAAAKTDSSVAPRPVDVHDGIPDRAERPSRWRLPAVVGLFLLWAAFLLYCLLAGRK